MDQKLINAYELLEINENASLDEIKQAYRQKAKCYHPDLFFSKEDKKLAEAHFKKIKEAYDFLINNIFQTQWTNEDNETNNNFSSFFNQTDFFDDYDDFYYEQQEKSRKFESLQKKAIETIQQEIERRDIHILKVFNLIKENKIILKWMPGEISSDLLYDYLIKENLYRRYIKSTDDYQGFLKQEKFYHHLDLYATLKINPNLYHKKKFEKRFYYQVKSICPQCKGLGCETCYHHGFIFIDHNVNIKVPLEKVNKYYEINHGGNQTPIMDGKLILKVKIDYSLKEPYELKFKKSYYDNFISFFDFIDQIKLWFSNLWKWIINHKHLTILYVIILMLIITIICLGILL